MTKTILITGATDGIGLETAKALYAQGHHILLHGRNPAKLDAAKQMLNQQPGAGRVYGYLADLSRMSEVETLAREVAAEHDRLDVLLNNAGILNTAEPFTPDGLEIRFAVNLLAPCLLTHRLLPLLGSGARVVNLSSAAQAPVNLKALESGVVIHDQLNAYAQSKLAFTIWSQVMAESHRARGIAFVAVNPGSLLGTKMVKEGFGTSGKSINIGSDILVRASLSAEFEDASGKYFDNDIGRFADPHADARNPETCRAVVDTIAKVLRL